MTRSDELALSDVVRPHERLRFLDADDELVLLDGWRSATVLNPLAATICSAFDGERSLGSIAATLATRFEVAPTTAEAEVLNVARLLGDRGLLHGVEPTEPAVSLTPIRPLEAGDHVAAFDATPQHPPTPAERVVVNWNPSCGYCHALLARIRPLLAHRPPSAAVLLALPDTMGGPAVASFAAETGLEVLTYDAATNPFGGAGTPAAFHLDPNGVLLSAPVQGVGRVENLIRAVLGAPPSEAPPGDSPRYLLADDGACATAREQIDVHWAGTQVHDVDGFRFGIRYDAPSTAATLRRLLPGTVVDDDRAGHSFSLQLPPPDDPAGGLAVMAPLTGAPVRTRDPARALRALLEAINFAITDRFATADSGPVVQTRTLALGSAAGVVLVPATYRSVGPSLQARLATRDMGIVDVTRPTINLATAELVIDEPDLGHDPAVLAERSRPVTSGLELPQLPPGHHRLHAWCVSHPGPSHTAFSPAHAAAATMSLVVQPTDPEERFRSLIGLFRQVQGIGLWYGSERELLDAIATTVRIPHI